MLRAHMCLLQEIIPLDDLFCSMSSLAGKLQPCLRTRTFGGELLHNLGLVDQSLQVIEHRGGVPDVVTLPQQS